MRLAFIGDENRVMNVIVATGMDEATKAIFIDEAHRAYGAVWAVEVEDDNVAIWIGGTYSNDEGFLPPPPAPQPEIIEGTSEEIVAEIVEGTTNDDAPIE